MSHCSWVCKRSDAAFSSNHFFLSNALATTHLQKQLPVYYSLLINKINRYGFCILYLPSEATRLKTSITFIARTMETCGPFIVLKTHKCLLARDTRLLADGIVDVSTMRGEHFAIYVK